VHSPALAGIRRGMLCSTSWSVGTVARGVSRYRGAGGATLHRGSRTSCEARKMRNRSSTLSVTPLGVDGGDGPGRGSPLGGSTSSRQLCA